MSTSESPANRSSLNEIYPACTVTVRTGNLSGMIVTVEPSGLKIGTETPENLLNDYAVLFSGTPEQEVAIHLFSHSHFENNRVRERFIQQIKAQMSFSHPNLIKIVSFIEQDGFIYLVLEHFAGEPLDSIIKKGALPAGKADAIFTKVLDAFDYMHTKGFTYGEINPANIIISNEDIVKILPFGCVNMNGEGQISNDIRHLGILLFELKTGLARNQYPADYIKISQLMIDKSVPRGIAETISKAISENSANRYQNAGEFSQAIVASSLQSDKTLTDDAANRDRDARQSIEAVRAFSPKNKKTLTHHLAMCKKVPAATIIYQWIAPIIVIAVTALLIPASSILKDKEEKPLPAAVNTKAAVTEKPVIEPKENPVEPVATVEPVKIAPQKLARKVPLTKQEPQTKKMTSPSKKRMHTLKPIANRYREKETRKQGTPPQKTTKANTAASSTIEKSAWTIQK